MAIRNDSVLTDFNATAALRAVEDRVGDDIFVCGEFTPDDFHILYVSDRALEQYDSETDIWVVGDVIHEYMNVDFLERELFNDLYPQVTETNAFVTYTDYAAIVRVLQGEEGFYLSVDPQAPVSEIVNELTAILDQ
ncbi:hypothetical protein [Natranaeroarchaeum aerophilus]|uniref:Uncharacterized protein n=1 Tax=Natranaeroarchaeum aerophilus TaxID=2917711 RepID=A0AAE3K588_9EURY|nr:hypothetical protein [Natranaeroarchaeum aerophilus]MCL9814137.1 hypothetical protein [Natranaeroarchaeum aerophilus]